MAITVSRYLAGTSLVSKSITTVTGKLYILVNSWQYTVVPTAPTNVAGLTWTLVSPSLSGTTQCRGSYIYYAVCTAGSTATLTMPIGSAYYIDAITGATTNPIAQSVPSVITKDTTTPIVVSGMTQTIPNSIQYALWVVNSTTGGAQAVPNVNWTTLPYYGPGLGTMYNQNVSAYTNNFDTNPSATFGILSGTGSGAYVWALEIAPVNNGTFGIAPATYEIKNKSAYLPSVTNDTIQTNMLEAATRVGTGNSFTVTTGIGDLYVATSQYFSVPTGTSGLTWISTGTTPSAYLYGVQAHIYYAVSTAVTTGTIINAFCVDKITGARPFNPIASTKALSVGLTSPYTTTMVQSQIGSMIYGILSASTSTSPNGTGVNPTITAEVGWTTTGTSPIYSPYAYSPTGVAPWTYTYTTFRTAYRMEFDTTPSYTHGTLTGAGANAGALFLEIAPLILTIVGITPTSYALTNQPVGFDQTININQSSYTLTNNIVDASYTIPVTPRSYNLTNLTPYLLLNIGVNLQTYGITNKVLTADPQVWVPVDKALYNINNNQIQIDKQTWVNIPFISYFINVKSVSVDPNKAIYVTNYIIYNINNNDTLLNVVLVPNAYSYNITNNIVNAQVDIPIASQTYGITTNNAQIQVNYNVIAGTQTYNITNQITAFNTVIGINKNSYLITEYTPTVNGMFGPTVVSFGITNQVVQINKVIGISSTSYNVIEQPVEEIGRLIYINTDLLTYIITPITLEANGIININLTNDLSYINYKTVQIQRDRVFNLNQLYYTITNNLTQVLGNTTEWLDSLSYPITMNPVEFIGAFHLIDASPFFYNAYFFPIGWEMVFDIDLATYSLTEQQIEIGTYFNIPEITYNIINDPITNDGQHIINTNPIAYTIINKAVQIVTLINISANAFNITWFDASPDHPVKIPTNVVGYFISNKQVQVNANKNINITEQQFGITNKSLLVDARTQIQVNSAVYALTNNIVGVDKYKVIGITKTSYSITPVRLNYNAQTEIYTEMLFYLMDGSWIAQVVPSTIIQINTAQYLISNQVAQKELSKVFNIPLITYTIIDQDILVAANWLGDIVIDTDLAAFHVTNDPLFVVALNYNSYPDYRVNVLP